MTVDDFFNSEELRGKIAKYLDMRNVEERFEKSVKDLTANECLIPVLGTQGAGKSSFLNAILFADVVYIYPYQNKIFGIHIVSPYHLMYQ